MRERVLKKITFVVVFTCIFTTLIFAQKNKRKQMPPEQVLDCN